MNFSANDITQLDKLLNPEREKEETQQRTYQTPSYLNPGTEKFCLYSTLILKY